MNRYLAALAVSLALTAAHSFAREPQAPPSPTESGTQATTSLKRDVNDAGENIFVGHFGETLRLPYFWAADARMQGPMEVVNFHLATIEPMKVVSPPFNPKSKDYIPENFKRLRLMQLLVIPKNVPGGFKSLDEIREAKSRELDAAGDSYKLEKLGNYRWPPDSFMVWISTPYTLFQFYTQSDKNIFILTSGSGPYDENSGDPILTNSTARLCSSLETHLDEFRLKIIAERGFFRDLRIVVIPWALFCAFAAILSFLPKHPNWLRRLRLIGRATFVFISAWQILAGPVLFVAWRLGLGRTINEGSILFCAGLIMPWISKAATVRLGGQRPWRVFIWSAIANIPSVIVGYSFNEDFISGALIISGSQNFLRLSNFLCILGLLNGVMFGLAHQEDKTTNAPGDAS
jgi:hypothetical protein